MLPSKRWLSVLLNVVIFVFGRLTSLLLSDACHMVSYLKIAYDLKDSWRRNYNFIDYFGVALSQRSDWIDRFLRHRKCGAKLTLFDDVPPKKRSDENRRCRNRPSFRWTAIAWIICASARKTEQHEIRIRGFDYITTLSSSMRNKIPNLRMFTFARKRSNLIMFAKDGRSCPPGIIHCLSL